MRIRLSGSRSLILPALSLCLAQAALAPRVAAQAPVLKTIAFQHGADGYEGTTEFRLRADGLVEFGRDLEQYYLDGSPFANETDDTVEILRFADLFGSNPGQIPPRATVVDAQLTFTTGTAADAVTGGPYQLGRLISEVPESALYTDYPLDPATHRSVRSLTAEPWIAAAASVQAQEVISVDVTSVVQAWSDGEPNHGVTVFANDTTDGWQFSTVGNPDVTRRPKLTVTYTTNSVRVLDFPATSASVLAAAGTLSPTTNRTSAPFSTTSTNGTGILLRFDGMAGTNAHQLQPQDRVLGAKLILRTSGTPETSATADSNSPFTVHQILQDWSDASDFGTNGLTVAEGELADGTDEIVGMGEWTRVDADVTTTVSRWQAGQPNFGLHVKPGGANDWDLFLPAATDAARRPTLRVWSIFYTGTPTAVAKASAESGEPPLLVQFDGTQSFDPDGAPLQYLWTFEAGATATGAAATHTFQKPGVYSVTLQVTDAEGKTAESIVSVRVLGHPTAVVNSSLLRGPEPLRITASALGSLDPDGGSLDYVWSLGDGTSLSGESISHTYTRGGTFPLIVRLTDDEGRTTSLTNTVEVFETSLETAVFQQGVAGYTGTFQRRVQANGFAQSGREIAEYYLDGRPQTANQATNDTCELVRFDGIVGNAPGQIPPNATVTRAVLTYSTGTDANANTDGPWVIGYLTRAVDDATTYDSLDSGTGVAEERGPRGSVEPLLLAGFADIERLEVVSADVTLFVQRWVRGETNHGMAIFTDDTTDGWQISTISHPNPELRPRLLVDFTRSEVTRREFTVTRSALAAKAAETLDGSLLETFFLDGGADADYKEALLLFEDVFGSGQGKVPADERVLVSRLVTRTGGVPDSSGDADTDDPYTVHAMLVPWEVTSNYGTNGVSIAAGQAGPSVGAFLGAGERTWASVDVTPIVQAWSEGLPNHGLNIKPGGSDGWLFHWPLFPDAELHPKLVVWSEKARTPSAMVTILRSRITAGREFSLEWSSTPAASYRIETSSDLVTWKLLRATVPSAGSSTTATIPLSELAGDVRFLRIGTH